MYYLWLGLGFHGSFKLRQYIAIRWLRFKGWSVRDDGHTRQLILDGSDYIVVYFKYFRALSYPMPLGLRLHLYAAYMLALR